MLKPLGIRTRIREEWRSLKDLGFAARSAFRKDRKGAAYQAAFDEPEPLVTVCIATFNRGRLLTERSIPSILAQTYRNLELIVIGDGCTDDTAERVAAIDDPRLRFENFTERGRYPEDPHHRWMVAGTGATNRALSIARGSFVTHLDDDDEHDPSRIEKLLALIRRERADLVYHPFHYEMPDGTWRTNSADRFGIGKVTTSSMFYHRRLAEIPWDVEAWKYLEPGDWNRLRKLRFLGVRSVRHPDPLLSHYRERSQEAATA
ncbi:MAG TPA: glycosyltransferase family 2 protein [Allosphingosinicella sp.]|jgi:glycosyltransferase involved in cell wall biosynthesis